MFPYRLPILSALMSLPLLASCVSSKPVVLTKVQVEKIVPPASLLVCPDDPDIPDPLNDTNLARYIRDLWDRGMTCGDQLESVRNFVEQP